MTPFNSILIIGLGLIGGSLAKRIKKYHPDVSLFGTAPSTYTQQLAQSSGLFKGVYPHINECPNDIDCVFVCTPIELISESIHAASNHIQSNCIFTDVGSIKKDIINSVSLSKQHHIFIPGHPMAGTEYTGFAASDESIFTNSTYILIDTVHNHERLSNFLQSLHVTLVETDADTHDKMIALASHFPYVITTLIMNLVSDLPEKDQAIFKSIMGPGFKDTTRIAASSPEWGHDVSLHNITHLNTLLDKFGTHLNTFQDLLNTNPNALHTFFKEMQQMKLLLKS